MGRSLAVVLLLLAACASRDKYVDEETRDCSAGGELSVDLLFNMPKVMMEGTQDNLNMIVSVGNNSTHDIEVKSIRVEPGFTAQQRYALESSFRKFDKVLAPGEDEDFELPVRGVAGRRGANPSIGKDTIDVALSVYLANGVTYRCDYEIPAPK